MYGSAGTISYKSAPVICEIFSATSFVLPVQEKYTTNDFGSISSGSVAGVEFSVTLCVSRAVVLICSVLLDEVSEVPLVAELLQAEKQNRTAIIIRIENTFFISKSPFIFQHFCFLLHFNTVVIK